MQQVYLGCAKVKKEKLFYGTVKQLEEIKNIDEDKKHS